MKANRRKADQPFDWNKTQKFFLFIRHFLFQSKTKNAVKDINQNFTINNLNKKKSDHYTLRKRYFCEQLKFLWEVGARQCKKCSPGINYFRWTVLQGSANYFLMQPSDTSMINPVFQNKSWVTCKKNVTPCFSGRVKRSYLNHASYGKNTFFIEHLQC